MEPASLPHKQAGQARSPEDILNSDNPSNMARFMRSYCDYDKAKK